MGTIKLPYTPSITNDKVIEILKREYPQKKASKILNVVRINGNILCAADIRVIHSEKKNLTQIKVGRAFRPIGALTIILLPVGLITYIRAGKWAEEVNERLYAKFK